jgi:hypothetical protein
VNLVIDAPAVALGLEPAERDVMRRSPRPPSEPIMAGGLSLHALWVGLLMAAVCLVMLVAARDAGWPWQTMVFTTLALLQLGHALAVHPARGFFALGPWSNPLLAAWWPGSLPSLRSSNTAPLRELLRTELLDSSSAPSYCWLPAAFIAAEEKLLARRREPSHGAAPGGGVLVRVDPHLAKCRRGSPGGIRYRRRYRAGLVRPDDRGRRAGQAGNRSSHQAGQPHRPPPQPSIWSYRSIG